MTSINTHQRDMTVVQQERAQLASEAGQIIYDSISNKAQDGHGHDYRENSLSHHERLLNGDSSSQHSEHHVTVNVMEQLRTRQRMSAVRRTFCLIVTFDLIFTFILWVIYTQLIGDSPIWKAFEKQVTKYTFQLSLFDTVMVASFRFILLILTYALLNLNHWWPVAMTTLATCVFLLAKCFLFAFSNGSGRSNPLGYVVLIISFILTWIETWFLDFQVLPQELRERTLPIAVTERTPLLHESNTHGRADGQDEYYSPIDTPPVSDEDFHYHRSRQDTSTDDYHSVPPSRSHSRSQSRNSNISITASDEQEYIRQGKEVFEEVWRLLNTTEGWKLDAGKDLVQGCVYTRHVPHIGKVFMCRGYVNISAKRLFEELVYGMDDTPRWNPTVTECWTIHHLDESTDISYNVAAEGMGGIVSSRDFVNLRRWGCRDGIYISSGKSTTHPEMPPQKKYVRGENGPGAWISIPQEGNPDKCEFVWIMNTNLKGWVPQAVIDQTLSRVLLDYLKYIRLHVDEMKRIPRL